MTDLEKTIDKIEYHRISATIFMTLFIIFIAFHGMFVTIMVLFDAIKDYQTFKVYLIVASITLFVLFALAGLLYFKAKKEVKKIKESYPVELVVREETHREISTVIAPGTVILKGYRMYNQVTIITIYNNLTVDIHFLPEEKVTSMFQRKQ